MKLSIVIPCYKSYNTLGKVVGEINSIMNKRPEVEYEIILVNDCSPDRTLDIIKELCSTNSHIKGIDLAKNFGQASALMAGFSFATGDYIATAEDDGQSSINEIWKMLEKMDEGYDIVCARNVTNPPRSLFRKIGAKINRIMLDFMLDKPKTVSPSIFFVAKKQIIEEMLKYDKPYPYIGGLILRSTSKIGNIDIQRAERISGESGYTLKKLIGLLLNGVTAFSIKPLRLASILGVSSFAIGSFSVIFMGVKYFLYNNVLLGYTSTISIMLILGGMILLVLGIIGEYIGRIYMCLNHDPQFVVRNKYNVEEDTNEEL